MTTLAEFQAKLQQAIVDGDNRVLDQIASSSREEKSTLLGVYQNAYVSRLFDALAEDCEKLAALLGDQQFDVVARHYITANPSRSPNLRWFGQAFPEFLRAISPYCESSVLAELATLESALNDVFDAEDAPRLELQELAEIAPEHWPDLSFESHPAVRRFDHGTNAVEIWRALDADSAPPEPADLDEPINLIAFRPEFTARFREMSPAEATIWDAAAAGARFADICELLEAYDNTDDAAPAAAGFLRGWIEAGFLTKATLPASRHSNTS